MAKSGENYHTHTIGVFWSLLCLCKIHFLHILFSKLKFLIFYWYINGQIDINTIKSVWVTVIKKKINIKFFSSVSMASVPLFMRQIAPMTPRHLAPNKGVEINLKISVLYIYRIIKKIYMDNMTRSHLIFLE